MTQPSKTLLTLQAGRGVAAMAVALHHAGRASDDFAGKKWGDLFEYWYLGVDFFFVLSGFIIFHAHGADPKTWAAATKFLRKRLCRIYLPYLPVVIALILTYQLLPGMSQGNRDWSLLTSLTLIPTGQPSALSVAWTLVFEMCFYTVFLLSYYTGILRYVVVTWGAAVLLLWGLETVDWSKYPVAMNLLHPIVLEFLMGMGAAWALQNLPASQGRFWLILGISGAILFFALPEAHRVLFGLTLAPLVLGLAMVEQTNSIRVPRFLVVLGSASYALYLVHNPLMSLVARAVADFQNWTVTFALCCASAVVAGLAYHMFFERPVLRYSGRVLTAAPEAR